LPIFSFYTLRVGGGKLSACALANHSRTLAPRYTAAGAPASNLCYYRGNINRATKYYYLFVI